jgi:hypothetical protein
MRLEPRRLADLTVDDRDVFTAIGLYRDLEAVVARDQVSFWVPAPGERRLTWARALFLNLTFWGEDGTDVLERLHVPADVVTHVAWHHLARRALGAASADALFLAEAIASAFDLYLVGRLLGRAPECAFVETQVPALTDAAFEAGASELAVERLFQDIEAEPERAFEDLRQLLFDAASELCRPQTVPDAAGTLARLAGHRFGPFLHHYELSNWILHARARTPDALAPDPAVRQVDAALRDAPDSLAWLERSWLQPP